jgi:hypothetical protein
VKLISKLSRVKSSSVELDGLTKNSAIFWFLAFRRTVFLAVHASTLTDPLSLVLNLTRVSEASPASFPFLSSPASTK